MKVLGRFVLAATALGGFALLERHGPPGDGFLVLEFVAIAVFICVPLSIAAACWVLFRAGRHSSQVLSQSGSGFFLGR